MRVDHDHSTLPSLRAVYDGARHFGLSDEQAWEAIDDALSDVGPDASVADCFEAVSGALARRILAAQRSEETPVRPAR